MKMRPGPKNADRKRRRVKRAGKQRRGAWNRNMALISKLARQYVNHRSPTEITIVLRLINILGLALIVMVVAVLSNDGNIKEIVDLGKELFHLLP